MHPVLSPCLTRLPHLLCPCTGSFDRFLNLQIALVIAMQLAMCLFCAIANYIWIQKVGAAFVA